MRLPRHRFSRFHGAPAFMGKQRAFTLVELVVVIVLTGILAVVAIPRFADQDAFAAAGFANQLRAALQYAHKSAVAMRRTVCVDLSAANRLTFTYNLVPAAAGCAGGAALPLPGGSDNRLPVPAGVAFVVAPANVNTLTFSGLGRPNSDVRVTVNVTGGDGMQLSVLVEPESGYVH